MKKFTVKLLDGTLVTAATLRDINTKVNVQQTYSLNLTNTFNFKIQSFQFKNTTGFTFPSNISLNPNQTKSISFTFIRSAIKSEQLTSEVSFKYLVDLPQDPQTVYVNITPSGYSPAFLIIHATDTVIWKNIAP